MWPSQAFSRFGFDPFADFRRIQRDMNRAFSEFATSTARSFPPVNLWLGENSVVVTAELPGATADDVDITLNQNVLTLRGERKPEIEQDANWHRRERTYGRFSRAVQLPFQVDPERVQARFNNGILEIELVRPENDRPKKIAIRAD